MENNRFKSVAFGGFDKQDVVSYIEKTAKEAAGVQAALQQENDGLRQEKESLSSQLATIRYQLETLRTEHAQLQEEHTRLQKELAQETAKRQELEPQAESLSAELAALQPDAQAYARLRQRLGDIECEARQRAAKLEDETNQRLRQTAERFRLQYQALMDSFEAAAAHINSELRKVEVNLTQLPRALDQSGTELERLEALLKGEEAAE